MKALREMSLEELWQLFPIELSAPRPEWKLWAAEEISHLTALLARFNPVINHIGSTAIPTIRAKPIVDLLVEVPRTADREQLQALMLGSGYLCMNSTPTRMSFNKGYTPSGYAERVFHIHIHLNGDNDEVRFRDYLLSHPEAAADYEALKQSLLPRFRNNRDAYTDAKADFVHRILRISKQEV